MPATLTGIRVIDFGRYIAGPFCAALLADLGADVIRVERPEGGEDRALLPVRCEGEGAYFLQMNRNKRDLILDTTKPQGREVLAKLIAKSDVVIANLPRDAHQARRGSWTQKRTGYRGQACGYHTQDSTRHFSHHPKKLTGYRGQAMGTSPIFSVGRVRLRQEIWNQ